MSLELLVLFATVVAIWMPACAANPDGTWTNIAGKDAVNALILVTEYPQWNVQSMETTIRANCKGSYNRE